MKKKKIILFSLDNLGNGGDEMLGDTTEFLVKKCGNYDVERAQLKPHYKELGGWYAIESLIGNGIKWLSLKLPVSQTNKHRLYNIAYRIQYGRYYANVISGKDAVIYAGGMLKYSTQNLSFVFELINRQADKKGIPVLMNAMSIEKSNDKDWRYRQVVRAVNLPCVKMITSRDGKEGVERLRKEYIQKNDIITDYVGDPALWAPECYNIAKRFQSEDQRLGIGLIRTNIFESYKGRITGKELYNFYKELIIKVIGGGKSWYLFCNGMDCDYEVGINLIKELGLPEEKLLPAPKSARDLLELVSSFDIIFGARLHSCITSVSLGIPVAGLLWDDKLEFFSKTMKIQSSFSDIEEIDADIVYKKIESANNNGIDMENVESYKLRTLQNIKRFLDNV